LDNITADSTVEYGRYLAHSVANCHGCHTDRSLATGEFLGEPFAGGLVFTPTPETGGFGFVTPNITPDPSGKMEGWSEATFIARMRGGRIHQGSPMPWGPFSRMTDSDIKAIYRYLRTVEPVKKTIVKTMYKPEEINTMPKPS
jgi:mono/diheme cytochrome c family protein